MVELYKQYRKRDKRNQWSILVQTEVGKISNWVDVTKSDSYCRVRHSLKIEGRPNKTVLVYANMENKFLKALD